MTEIVKLTVDGEDHWTAEGSPAHEELLARLEAEEADEEDGGQTEEEGAGVEQQQEPEVPGEGNDHDTAGASSGSGVRSGDDSGVARGKRRGGSSQPASGS
jgi:hypothetical protein